MKPGPKPILVCPKHKIARTVVNRKDGSETRYCMACRKIARHVDYRHAGSA